MRKRHWKNRKNRKCPSCSKILTYTRKDAFDRAVGNNSVCKSCAQSDRKFTLETIEKMKQPNVKHPELDGQALIISGYTRRVYNSMYSPEAKMNCTLSVEQL